MIIKRGTRRLAICFSAWGFVVKLPIPKPVLFFEHCKDGFRIARRMNDWSKLKRVFWLDECHDNQLNIRYSVLNGTFQNWKEYRLWRRVRSPFLEPTYFSLFGLVNIQRYGNELDIEKRAFRSQIHNLTEGTAEGNSHEFFRPSNYSFRDGTIRMFDYGGGSVEKVIVLYGEAIVKNFDPTID